MFRNLLLIGLIIITGSVTQASPIDAITAGKVAGNFIKIKSLQYPAYAPASFKVKDVLRLKENGTMAYAVNFLNGGFVIVVADDASQPVLAYSYEGVFSDQNLPPVVADWMQYYYQQLQDIRNNNIPATPEIREAWNQLINDEPVNVSRGNRDVSPLLNTTWDQGAPYNDLCPEAAGGPNGHVYSGCVATAMSQVVNYWRYPRQGTGSHGYTSDYGYLFVDYSQSNYDYDQMTASIGSEGNYEMAELQYHLGVSVNMMYSPNGSGAYSEDVDDALKTYFGYSTDLHLEYKEDHSSSEWAEQMKANIDNGWPMYYSGYGSGGHAFNLDGYQGDDYFHFNWGWSGSYNGYFYLSALNPGGNDFSGGQSAIVNFHPGANYPYYCTGVDTLTRHSGTIDDGSGPVDNYIAGLQCGWLIAPQDSVTGLTLYFDKFDLAQGDVLNVFDGSSSAGSLIGSYTGNSLPAAVSPTTGKLYLEFLTSGTQGKGWMAHYNSTMANYCSGITHYTDASGSFSDGSGNRDYLNSCVCKYIIQPENAASITVSFDSFNTEPDMDKVKIYDMVSQQMVAEVSGNQIPEDIVVPSGKAYVLFLSNPSVAESGWDISYTSTITATENITPSSKNTKLFCSPNPAESWLRMELKSKTVQDVEIWLVASDGRAKQLYKGSTGTEPLIITTDISNTAPGLYLVKYVTDTETGSQKVIIK